MIGHLFFTISTNDKIRLVLFSFLMLFVELTLIRWSSSTLYHLFFFSNFVLLASFLGIAIGFMRSKISMRLFPFTPFFLAGVIFFCYFYCYEYHPQIDIQTNNLNYKTVYFKNNLFPILLSLPLVFIGVTFVMTCIADGVGRIFQQFPPLQAYRLEIIGSLLGIIIFSLLSYLHALPIWWGIIISVLTLVLLPKEKKISRIILLVFQILALIIMLGTFAKESMRANHFWSTYYKIEIQPFSKNKYVVNVNGLAQQIIESADDRKKMKPFYLLPYQEAKNNSLDNVLIIGSGTGGDVAIALAQGAKQIDAVEIDPMLYQLGKKLNPDHPYDYSRVHVYINDGRAFLQQSNKKYDMIIFALTDSLMLIPGQSSMRLENYLYTKESITRAAQLLKTNGVLTIYNYYNHTWLINRLANTLTQVFKHAPCLNTFGERDFWPMVLSISHQTSALQCASLWQPVENENARPSTDNRPFLYLQTNTLSPIYLITLGTILLFSIFAMRLNNISVSIIKNNLDLFLMGAAFLLLETKSIINFALLFGTTWFVNVLVFIGVLFVVYLAVEIKHRCQIISISFLSILLCFMLLLAWLIPSDTLLLLSIPLRFIVATGLAFGPILIANLMFAERFNHTINPREALGANFMGAVLGGLLEYSSLIIGYHNLFFIIAALYGLAIMMMLYKTRYALKAA